MNDQDPSTDATTRRLDTAALERLRNKAMAKRFAAPASEPVNLEKTGDWIGRYRLIEELGEGGFGVVWRAEQTEPIHREVALKVIKPGMDSREIIKRFELERQTLALMEHPNIAAVLDAGATESGRPYFVMEIVKGVSITSYCDANKLTISQRLKLFIPVCQAVQHAHQKAILHRDLKPSNILITEVDGKPTPKVIDFGIAKALCGSSDVELPASFMQTQAGMIIGTLQYMSPEQAGSRPDVDTRSDIYTLGVILYELLTGSTPVTLDQLKAVALDEVLRLIREGETKRPSSQLLPVTTAGAKCATMRQSEPRKLSASMRGDLDWIVLKALEKERDRRYESATALAEDIRNYMEHEPVSAGPPTAGYRLRKLMRKHRIAFAAGITIIVVLAAGILTSLLLAARATQAEAETRKALEEAERNRAAADDSRADAELNFKKARAAVDQYLTQVTDNQRLKQADFNDLRSNLLKSALPFYEQFVEQKGEDLELKVEQAKVLSRLALIYQETGDITAADTSYRRALEIQEKLLSDFPAVPSYWNDVAGSYNNLGNLLKDSSRWTEAEAAYRRSLEIQEKLANDSPDEQLYQERLAGSYQNLGDLFSNQGKGEAADDAFRRAAKIWEKLATNFPSVANYRRYLASTLFNIGNFTQVRGQGGEAEMLYRRALEIQENLVAEFPAVPSYSKDVAGTQANLGFLLQALNRPSEAVIGYLRAVEIWEKLATDFPSVPLYRSELSNGLVNLGGLLRISGQTVEAEAAYRRSLDVGEKLVADSPAVPDYRNALAKSLFNLGNLLRDYSRWVEAEAAYRRALDIQEKLATDFPAVPTFRQNLARGYSNLGILLNTRDRGVEGEVLYRRALEIQEKLASDFPAMPSYLSELGASLNNFGMVLEKQKKLQEGRKLFVRAIAAQIKARAAEPMNPTYLQFLGNHYGNLARICIAMNDHATALTNALELPKLYPGSWKAYHDAATLIAECIPMAERDSTFTPQQQEQTAESYARQTVELLRQSIASGYKDVPRIKAEKAFAPLLSRPDFQALLE